MANIGFIKNELDLKLLVLYIMSHAAEPITFFQLLEIALCDAGVDYFSLTQAVTHMVETGQLECQNERYTITEKGRRNGAICESSLSYSVRIKCDKNLARLNATLRRNAQVRAEILPRTDGTFTLRLSLDDDDSNMLTIELLTATELQASHLAEQFRARPELIYNRVLDVLLTSGGRQD